MTAENSRSDSAAASTSATAVLGPRRAIILAGRRSADDPFAEAAGAPHRALLDIDGEPMLVRVAKRLAAWPSIDRVLINIDEPGLLDNIPDLKALRDSGVVEILKSTNSPSQSVLESLDWADLTDGPALVTTADHALLDDAMLEAFFRDSEETDADLTFALVPRSAIEARFPETKRTYLKFRDGAFSGANLFLFHTPKAAQAASFWRRIESQRKRPWRIARAFGYLNLVLFLAKQLDLENALKRASKVMGVEIRPISIPIAEAAIDVDKIADLKLVRRILADRRVERNEETPRHSPAVPS